MKRLLLMWMIFLSIGNAIAEVPTQGQIRYEEWFAQGVEQGTARHLACVNQRSQEGRAHEPCDATAINWIGGLGVNRGAAGDKTLAQLWAFILDGEFAIERRCISLIRGKSLLPYLKALTPAQARQRCLDLFNKAEVTKGEFSKVIPNRICHTEEFVQQMQNDIIRDIEADQTCEPWNID
jgi:hypothetical protein